MPLQSDKENAFDMPRNQKKKIKTSGQTRLHKNIFYRAISRTNGDGGKAECKT